MPPPALGPPLSIPPALWDPAHLPGFSRHPSPSVTLHQLHTAPRLRAHRCCDQWDPVTNRLLMHVSPFSSPSTPPLCPPLTGMDTGAVGPSPRFVWRLGLRVSSRGQWFSPYPPFSKAPCPLRLPGPTLLWPTRRFPACSTYWCWCPLRSPLPLILCSVSIGARYTPYGLALRGRHPPYVHYSPPSHPILPPFLSPFVVPTVGPGGLAPPASGHPPPDALSAFCCTFLRLT